ncbi:MAG: FitA-like ribbon-helix-helix domain-containing protein [Acidimicrobiales bacterium]
MGQLIVRNLDDELVRRLKIRAAERGHSAEEEHREILRQALAPGAKTPLRAVLMAIPNVGEDADFRRDDDLGREPDW